MRQIRDRVCDYGSVDHGVQMETYERDLDKFVGVYGF